MLRTTRAWGRFAPVVFGIAIACGDETVTAPAIPASVVLSPAFANLEAFGDTVRFIAQVRDQYDRPVEGVSVVWGSSDATVATVDAAGLVTAVGAGTTEVTAASGGVSSTAPVTVEQRVAAVRASPASDTLRALGDTVRLMAEATDANGYSVADAEFTWSSSNKLVATVDSAGLVTAVGKGRADIAAASVGVAATAIITVLPRTHQKELAALVALYNSTDGPTWSNNADWLTEEPVSDWYGVRTDGSGSVTGIYLEKNNLKGTLPRELGDLTNLQALSLWGNQLAGSIPPELSKLANLQDLWLTLNSLSGPIPPGLGGLSHLEDLLLEVNKLHGPIPPELGNLTALRRLGLAGNQLSGPIPPELGNLTALRRLGLSDNQLSGPIPSELGNLASLRKLSLGGNQLVGPIPPELGNLGNLIFLEIQNSGLTGPIPPELGNLSNLLDLWLWKNELSGPIPPELGSLSSLVKFQLQWNDLTGPIPPELGNLTSLEQLYAQNNRLEGPIPPELGALAALEILQLSSNRIDGAIPPELGSMTALRFLNLSRNRLTGAIPPELGNLGQLGFLGVANNRLAGGLPVELADLSQLRYMYVQDNGLSGPIPLEFTSLSPDWFLWDGTSLCAPRRRAFQDWLKKVPDHAGATCPPAYREALAAVFESAHGSGWTRKANWLTERPLSTWDGVTMEDSLLTALELPENGLMGTLPDELVDFVGLRRLDLSGNALTGEIPMGLDELSELESLDLSRNRFSGPVPREFGNLSALERLDLSYNNLTGALPGTLIGLGNLKDFSWHASGACAPSATWFRAWLAAMPNHTGGEDCTTPIVLSLPAAHLTQAAQSIDGEVPLIVGRRAMLRVFATADRANDHRPRARVAFYIGGREVHVADAELVSSRGLPEGLDPGQADQSFQVQIPGDVLRPGLEMVVEVDPGNSITLSQDSQTRFPAEGRLTLDVRETPPMKLTIVPVLAEASADSSVLDWTAALDSDHPAIEFMSNVLPVADVDLEVREPLLIPRPPQAASVGDWVNLIQGIELLYAVERGEGYWYGAVTREGQEGVRGIGVVGGTGGLPVGAGIPDSTVLAHELGHNMSLGHAPCGGPAGLDANYPHRYGSIGVWGYDFQLRKLVPPETPDLMSYCDPQWISGYSFTKALTYRIENQHAPSTLAAAAETSAKRLLLWGSRDQDGRLSLDPAFAIEAPMKMPTGVGPYRLEGLDAAGGSEFAVDFDMDELSEGGGSFLFLIQLDEEWLGSLERIVLTGPNGNEAALDRASNIPIAIVQDRLTGRIRSILRGDQAEVLADRAERAAGPEPAAAVGADPDTRIIFSRGIPGRSPGGR